MTSSDATCCSIAQYDSSVPALSLQGDDVCWAAHSYRHPRNRCSTRRIGDTLPVRTSITVSLFVHCGLREQIPPPRGCRDPSPTTPTASPVCCPQMTTARPSLRSVAFFFRGHRQILRHALQLLVHVGLEPSWGHPSDPSNACQGQALQQQFIHQLPSGSFYGLSSRIINKLASTVTTAIPLFTVVSASVFHRVCGLTTRASHGHREGHRLPLIITLLTITSQHYQQLKDAPEKQKN